MTATAPKLNTQPWSSPFRNCLLRNRGGFFFFKPRHCSLFPALNILAGRLSAKNWASLNGEWQFEIDDKADGARSRFIFQTTTWPPA